MTEKTKAAVRIARLEVCGLDGGDFAEARKAWSDLSAVMKRVANDFHTEWLRLHSEAGDHISIRKWLRDDVAWVRTPKPDRKPVKRLPCPVKCLDSAVSQVIWRRLTELHPGVHSRVLTLAINTRGNTLKTAKATNSAYPRWMRILSGDGEFPSSSRDQPIPFDSKNGRLFSIKGENGPEWRFELRVDRLPRDGSPIGTSTLYRLKIRTGGRRLQSLRAVLENVSTGKWPFKGSHLAKRDGKWYVLLCYQVPKPDRTAGDPARVAVLSPRRRRPVALWLDGFCHWLQRNGRDVFHVRRSLLVQRWTRQENYRWASSSQKGHGYGKQFKKVAKLSRRWRDFVKTYNERLARDVLSVVTTRGYGALVYMQPEGKRAERRFLSSAGKVPERTDGSSWDWFQLKTLLARRCEEVGVEFSTRKCGGSRAVATSSARSGAE